MDSLFSNVISSLDSQSLQRLEFKFDYSLAPKLTKRFPNLNEGIINVLSTFGKVINYDLLSDDEVYTIINSSLQYLEIINKQDKYREVLSPDSLAFDNGGNIISNEFDREEIIILFKKILASNKTISKSFIKNYITNIG